jgi:hypothetical protein
MIRTLKSAPELERYILNALSQCAACNSISAVTVSAVGDRSSANWDVTHIHAPGGVIPQACTDICAATVEQLRESFDLVTEIESDEL